MLSSSKEFNLTFKMKPDLSCLTVRFGVLAIVKSEKILELGSQKRRGFMGVMDCDSGPLSSFSPMHKSNGGDRAREPIFVFVGD